MNLYTKNEKETTFNNKGNYIYIFSVVSLKIGMHQRRECLSDTNVHHQGIRKKHTKSISFF
jgi:hypothetical protein